MKLIEKVIQTLESMIAAHSKALDLAEEKRHILVEGNIQGLERLIHLETNCADEIQKLEEQRSHQVQACMMQHGYTGSSYTLEELIGLLHDTVMKNKLNSLAKQLRTQIQEIAGLNESNQQLIQASLSYIQYSMGLFVQREPVIGYGPNSAKRYANLLDAKI
ncbi:flagellar protein FlgN [Neobacillus mesonae]|uniref:flagellar protein FlgN n=1 Tax=Neobacillus mesonae TaxID=1193713 RepID=UPI002041E1C0|nr:flagellar protein FlgN [Neobacillus mesonae]MCM3567020.1 flagellar protein FlgN [Neobacillus mesonae]